MALSSRFERHVFFWIINHHLQSMGVAVGFVLHQTTPVQLFCETMHPLVVEYC
jgi:hypothetical protein